MTREREKPLAAEASVELVEPGMVLGLGTGSTAVYAVRKLGQRVRGGLHVRGLPTSEATRRLAEAEGIPRATFDEVRELDLTLDGADEFDPQLNLTKGGGGALLDGNKIFFGNLTLWSILAVMTLLALGYSFFLV